jgi:hypothetical protein
MLNYGSHLHMIVESGLMCAVNDILSLSAMIHQICGCWYSTYLVIINPMNGPSGLEKNNKMDDFANQ